MTEHVRNEWLTPQVLSLAQAAYSERLPPKNLCKRCRREVKVWRSYSHNCNWMACADCRISLPAAEACVTSEDGTLDPLRLAILADALEEAGCDNEEILDHLRWVRPSAVVMAGPLAGQPVGLNPNGTYSPCPVHVRGCWALDLILGRS